MGYIPKLWHSHGEAVVIHHGSFGVPYFWTGPIYFAKINMDPIRQSTIFRLVPNRIHGFSTLLLYCRRLYSTPKTRSNSHPFRGIGGRGAVHWQLELLSDKQKLRKKATISLIPSNEIQLQFFLKGLRQQPSTSIQGESELAIFGRYVLLSCTQSLTVEYCCFNVPLLFYSILFEMIRLDYYFCPKSCGVRTDYKLYHIARNLGHNFLKNYKQMVSTSRTWMLLTDWLISMGLRKFKRNFVTLDVWMFSDPHPREPNSR